MAPASGSHLSFIGSHIQVPRRLASVLSLLFVKLSCGFQLMGLAAAHQQKLSGIGTTPPEILLRGSRYGENLTDIGPGQSSTKLDMSTTGVPKIDPHQTVEAWAIRKQSSSSPTSQTCPPSSPPQHVFKPFAPGWQTPPHPHHQNQSSSRVTANQFPVPFEAARLGTCPVGDPWFCMTRRAERRAVTE